MGWANNPATDPETYPTTAEVRAFTPLLFLDHDTTQILFLNLVSSTGKNTKISSRNQGFSIWVGLRQDGHRFSREPIIWNHPTERETPIRLSARKGFLDSAGTKEVAEH